MTTELDNLLETVDNTTILSKDDWDEVNESMEKIRAKWFGIGILLKVKKDFLEELDDKNLNPEKALSKTLGEWLVHYDEVKLGGKPTWRMLARVAGKRQMDVAREIARNHPATQQQLRQPPPQDHTSKPQTAEATPVHLETAKPKLALGQTTPHEQQGGTGAQPHAPTNQDPATQGYSRGMQFWYDAAQPNEGTQSYFTFDLWRMKGIQMKHAHPVVIAVLDSGIAQNKPFLDPRQVIRQRNFTSTDRHDITDETGHGTMCAAIAAGKIYEYAPKIGKGHSYPGGVAQGAKLIVYKVSNAQKEFTGVVEALDDLLSLRPEDIELVGKPGPLIDVVSMSFGNQSEDRGITARIHQLTDRGTRCVAAAGNYGRNSDCLEYPAKLRNVISVGAIDANGEVCRFTTKDTLSIDFFAHGEGIKAPSLNNKLEVRNGTSLATPAVAGIIALLIDWVYDSFPNDPQKQAQIHDFDILLSILREMRNDHGNLQPSRFFDERFKDRIKLCLHDN